jgi:hypothetical protein
VRRLILLLAALAATLATGLLGPVAALGATALGTQDRAGAFDPPGVLPAGGRSVESPCSRPDSNATGGGIAAGCFVGDEEAAGFDAAEEGTTLYRAVGDDEAADIRATGTYRIAGGSADRRAGADVC